MLIRGAMVMLWLLQWLPLPALAALGHGLGRLGYWVVAPRRRVTLINLRLCFPHLTEHERRRLAKTHFCAFARAFVDHGILWFGSRKRIHRLVRFVDIEHWRSLGDAPVILLAPHFVGLDMGGIRLTTEYRAASMYTKQKNRKLDDIIRRGRERFGTALLFSRQDGIRAVIRSLKSGWPLYYLPDMDFGPRESIFVPFFGMQAATIPTLSRLAAVTGARVVPCVTKQLPGGGGYEARFYPAWENFPSDDIEVDTRRMNEFIEERVREIPEQYLWSHKRFKTRPAGEAKPY